ncbi:MAG: hypothetical protein ACX93T_03745 [Bacteroidota bacterium]
MKFGVTHHFFVRLVWLYLAVLLLGARTNTCASPLGKQPPEGDTTSKHTDKSLRSSHGAQKLSLATLNPDTLSHDFLNKLMLLTSTQTGREDLLARLEQLVAQQHNVQTPYVPLVQAMGIALDYGRLVMCLISPDTCSYIGTLDLLLRDNLQLSGTLGYHTFVQKRSINNRSSYKMAIYNGSIGLERLWFYRPRTIIYTGLRYGIGQNATGTMPISTEARAIKNKFPTSWCEWIIGAEQQLFRCRGLYAGLIFHWKWWGSRGKSEYPTIYRVSSYGRRKLGSSISSITFYIKYRISFLKERSPLTNH